MFIPVCIDLIHFNKFAHNFMYQKYLNICKKNGWPLICNDFFRTWEPANQGQLNGMIGTGTRWDFEYVPSEERDDVKQYFIPSAMFDELAERKGSRLEASLIFQNELYEPLMELFDGFLQDIMANTDEKIEGILLLEKSIAVIDTLAEKYGIPVICGGKGPLRSPYYIETAYFNFGDVYGTDECEHRYNQFMKEWNEPFEFFTNEELLAIFLDKTYLPYLKYYDVPPTLEMSVAGTYCVMPTLFSKTMANDIEIIREVQEKFPGKYLFRPNPADPFEAKYHLPDAVIDKSAPSLLAILASKRTASMGSNILFDVMLWNRVSCCKTDLFPFGFMCEKTYGAEAEKKAPVSFLNFFCFAYLPPFELAWDIDYIRWRLTNPSEMEIFRYHMEKFLEQKGIDTDCVKLSQPERQATILSYLGYSPDLVQGEENVDLKECRISTLTSEKSGRTSVAISRKIRETNAEVIYKSTFATTGSNSEVFLFVPTETKNVRIKIDSCYFEDSKGGHTNPTMFRVAKGERKEKFDQFYNVMPQYRVGGAFGNAQTMTVTWRLLKSSQPAAHTVPATVPAPATELPADVKGRLRLLEQMENSFSWKITKPLRAVRSKFGKK
ncbi:MAG: hypothetical protein IJF09_08575 [Ruminiclostridium sp.]|nr:hypothetical protein [Ruminiclostridium sp.]